MVEETTCDLFPTLCIGAIHFWMNELKKKTNHQNICWHYMKGILLERKRERDADWDRRCKSFPVSKSGSSHKTK